MKINLIVAVDSKGGIGLNGGIPWAPLKEDMKYFKELTIGSTVIMGRKTWESIGKKPLAGRFNLVISNTMQDAPHVCRNFNQALFKCFNNGSTGIFVIGGADIYREAIDYFYDKIESIYMTVVMGNYNCDVFFPTLSQNKFRLASASLLYRVNSTRLDLSRKSTKYRFLRYDKYELNKGEYAYLYLLSNIISTGDKRETRNGWTRSLFSERLEFDLNLYFPMATIRRVPIRWVFEELMWIIRGQTDTKILEDKGIDIWKGNSSREFLDSRGLKHFKEGQIGATYGFLMRNFGGVFGSDDSQEGIDDSLSGIDQLQVVLKKIKETPNDRRLIISLWDPVNIDKCALPPCLRDYQFYVADGKLSCQATLRSSDAPVALHWNICTAGLLTHLCAKQCDLKVGKLVMIIGDAHIYEEHVEEVKEQLLGRSPRPYPILRIMRKKDDITHYQFEDLEIIGYFPDEKPLNLVMKP